MRLNPIVATLGTNALLYGAVLWYTAGIPTHDDRPSRPDRRWALVRHSGAAVLRGCHHGHRHGGDQADAGGSPIRGRRRERDGCAYRRAPRATPSQRRLRVGAAPLLPRGHLACRDRQPADGLRGRQLPAADRRGGRARRHLAARRSRQPRRHGSGGALPLATRPVRACPRRTYATRSLVQAGALAVGVALYTIDWGAITRRSPVAATPASRQPNRPRQVASSSRNKQFIERKGARAR